MEIQNSKFKIQNSGLSLIELVVAIGLFATAMLIGGGMILSIIKAQGKAEAVRATMNNLGFAMELMTKEIRTGMNYPTPDGLHVGDLRFINALGEIVTYRTNSGVLEKKCERSTGGIPAEHCGGSADTGFLPLTDPYLVVTRWRYKVSGGSIVDDFQPKITIIMGVRYGAAGAKDSAELNLQTTISQRKIDR